MNPQQRECSYCTSVRLKRMCTLEPLKVKHRLKMLKRRVSEVCQAPTIGTHGDLRTEIFILVCSPRQCGPNCSIRKLHLSLSRLAWLQRRQSSSGSRMLVDYPIMC